MQKRRDYMEWEPSDSSYTLGVKEYPHFDGLAFNPFLPVRVLQKENTAVRAVSRCPSGRGRPRPTYPRRRRDRPSRPATSGLPSRRPPVRPARPAPSSVGLIVRV